MKFVKFFGGTNFCGQEFERYEVFNDMISEEELSHYAGELAQDNAAMFDCHSLYGLSEEDYDTIEDYETALEEASAEFYENAWGSWEEISEKDFLENGGNLADY